MLALFVSRWKECLIVLLIVSLAAIATRYRTSLIERGKAEVRAAHADSVLASLRVAEAHVDTLWRRDTVRLSRSIARVDTLRDSVVHHITDTLLVAQYITRTDNALSACSDVANDCAAFKQIAEARFTAYEQKLAAQPKAEPRSCTTSNVVALTIGAASGWVLEHAVSGTFHRSAGLPLRSQSKSPALAIQFVVR